VIFPSESDFDLYGPLADEAFNPPVVPSIVSLGMISDDTEDVTLCCNMSSFFGH
jgi:hypothetical protein